MPLSDTYRYTQRYTSGKLMSTLSRTLNVELLQEMTNLEITLDEKPLQGNVALASPSLLPTARVQWLLADLRIADSFKPAIQRWPGGAKPEFQSRERACTEIQVRHFWPGGLDKAENLETARRCRILTARAREEGKTGKNEHVSQPLLIDSNL